MTRTDATPALVLVAFSAFLAVFIGVLCQDRIAERHHICALAKRSGSEKLALGLGPVLVALNTAFARSADCPPRSLLR